MSECEHKFSYAGVRYRPDDYPMAGTGAKAVRYYEDYFCERCLEHRYKSLGYQGDTYGAVKFNATPMPYGVNP